MSQLVFVCTTCSKNVKGFCTEPPGACGGPLAGKAYPLYQGPLVGHLSKWCFVCGAVSDAAVEVLLHGPGEPSVTLVGVCSDHETILNTYSRPGKPPAFVTRVKPSVRT